MKLTAAFVANAKPNPDKRVEIPDAVLPGMYLSFSRPAPAHGPSVIAMKGGRRN